MVKHVILWKIKEEYSEEEKQRIKNDAKRELEALVGKIEGLKTLTIETSGLATSNADMMLYSEFSSEEALKGYAKHPLHCAAADGFVRPYIESRLCLDFEA